MLLHLHRWKRTYSAPPPLRHSVTNGKLMEMLRRGKNAHLVPGFGGKRNIGFVGEVINAGTNPEPSRLRMGSRWVDVMLRAPGRCQKIRIGDRPIQMTILSAYASSGSALSSKSAHPSHANEHLLSL